MNRYLLLALRARLHSGRSLYLLALLGVALGVASVLSIQIINQNALAAFSGSVHAVSGNADLSVLGQTPTFSDTLYPRILGTPGVAAVWPLDRIQVAVSGRRDLYLEVIGVDFFAPVRLPVRESADSLASALSRPGWIALTPSLAAEMGWKVGDPIEVSSGSRTATLVIGALVDFQKVSPLASRTMAVMDIAQAQSLLGRRGQITEVDVRVAGGTPAPEVERRLAARLGPSVRIVTPEQRENEAAGLMSAFRLNLTALSLISLVVGIFLIYTSTQASLLRRRPEFGLLRACGATRGQLLLAILGDVALMGGLGTGLGLLLGYWAARANLSAVSATITNLYLLEEIDTLRLPLRLYALAGVIGVGGALAGAIFPALDMTRRDTRALLVSFTLHEKMGSLAGRLAAAAVAILAVTGLWFALWGRGWRPGGFVLGSAILVGLPLLTPLLVQAVCGRIRIRSFGLGYSFKTLAVRLHTTAFAVAALGVAVSMLVGITIMVGSFRRTVATWIGAAVRADVYVTTESWARAGDTATLSPELAAELTRQPGIRGADQVRQFKVMSGDRRISLAGISMGLPEGSARYPLISGNRDEAIRRLCETGAVLIGEPLARKERLAAGDSLVLDTPAGPRRFYIAGVYFDYTTEAGSAAMDLRTMDRFFGPGAITNLALYLQPGIDAEREVGRLRTLFAGRPLVIRSNRDLREEILRIFDQTFAVTRLLEAMSLLIAVTGITLTLLVLARERVAELALYRALGALRRQIFRAFLGEGLGIGLLGLILGAFGGLGLAAILIFVINRAYFGWTIRLYGPYAALIRQAASILGASVVASVYPAVRASRVPATELSRENV